MTEVENTVVPAFQKLSDLVDNQPENYARGSQDIQSAALAATQYIFDLCGFLAYGSNFQF